MWQNENHLKFEISPWKFCFLLSWVFKKMKNVATSWKVERVKSVIKIKERKTENFLSFFMGSYLIFTKEREKALRKIFVCIMQRGNEESSMKKSKFLNFLSSITNMGSCSFVIFWMMFISLNFFFNTSVETLKEKMFIFSFLVCQKKNTFSFSIWILQVTLESLFFAFAEISQNLAFKCQKNFESRLKIFFRKKIKKVLISR